MCKKIVILVLLIVCALQASAQTFTLQGKVTDDQMNPVELATVSVLSQGRVAMTNLKGEFEMTLRSEDSVVVKFSMVGYKTKTRVLRRPRGKQTLQIQLYDDNQLAEVTVTEKQRQHTGTEQLDIKDVKQTPSVTGNAVEEMIQSQAGVSSHSELLFPV